MSLHLSLAFSILWGPAPLAPTDAPKAMSVAAATPNPTDPSATKAVDIEYGQAAGEKLLLDVSVPSGPGPFPIAILVHGGGWSSGDKSGAEKPGSGADITPWFKPLTDAKFTWFSINYRLAPKHRWPACLEDVQTAIRWVKANASRYKGDPSRIALFGHSAGGHLVTLAGTLVDDSVLVQAVVGYAPVTNHEQDLPARGGLSPSLQSLLNRPKEVTPESLGLLRAISPLNHVRSGLPPFLLVHGDADKTVPLQQSLDFQTKLRASGVRADLIVVKGAPHRLTDWDLSMPDHGARVAAWLLEVFGSGGPGKPAATVTRLGSESPRQKPRSYISAEARDAAGSTGAQPSKDEALAAMKRATTFMVDRVSLRGGYVWNVSEDLTKRWGEVPARPSQIWTQGGTPLAGLAFLDAFDATGDRLFLDAAKRAADALVFGQLEDGGWHYFIDFDPAGLDEWYRTSASKFTYGYEEYRYYYGNATNDDQVTSECARFLLRYFMTTLDPAYRTPLLKALDFVLKAQYPNGGWPQRYPLRFDFAHDGLPDYTSYYTLNDGAHQGYVELLLRAYRTLGDRRYLDAARRGAAFLLISQGPDGEAGWAEQFGPDLKPIAARTHEPAGYVIRESRDALRVLQLFYALTGDARYLAPIPRCLAWFERVNKEAVELKRPPARYYQAGTNWPVYVVRVPQKNAEGYGLYSWTHEPEGSMEVRPAVDVAPIRREYESVAALKSPESRAAYVASYLNGPPREAPPAPANVATLIHGLDSRGAWVTDVRVHQKEATPMHSGEGSPLRGISTAVFVRNLGLLSAYVSGGVK